MHMPTILHRHASSKLCLLSAPLGWVNLAGPIKSHLILPHSNRGDPELPEMCPERKPDGGHRVSYLSQKVWEEFLSPSPPFPSHFWWFIVPFPPSYSACHSALSKSQILPLPLPPPKKVDTRSFLFSSKLPHPFSSSSARIDMFSVCHWNCTGPLAIHHWNLREQNWQLLPFNQTTFATRPFTNGSAKPTRIKDRNLFKWKPVSFFLQNVYKCLKHVLGQNAEKLKDR